jgi:hypothetical protein
MTEAMTTQTDAAPPGDAPPAAQSPIAFIHIPKTAGTSFTRALVAGWPRTRIVATGDEFAKIPPAEARSLDLVAGHFFGCQLDGPKWRGRKAVTVLRDPRAKLVSSYRYARDMVLNHGVAGTVQMRFAARASFAEYAFSIHGVRDRHAQIYNLATVLGENPHDLPLADLLARAMSRIERIEVGTADRLQDYVDYLFRRFDRGSAPQLERLNTASDEGDFDLGLTAAQDAALRELMRPDEALLAHARAIFEHRAQALARGTEAIGLPPRPDPAVPARMLVGTFHKTGTMLMLGIMRRISNRLGRPMWVRNGKVPAQPWDIWFDAHSVFDGPARDAVHRAAVVIRDPRDVVISGAFYHAGPAGAASGDAWVDLPSPKFGGLTYKQAIQAQPDDEARLLFEMDNMAARTLARMADCAKPRPEVMLVRFEHLVTDTELHAFRAMFEWLGLAGRELEVALAAAREASIFSGNVRSAHVRSGQPEQWRQHFTPALHAAFRQRFGDIAERLGYPAA